MNRLERKLFTSGTHLAEKGVTLGSEVGGGLVGAGIGLLTGALSSGVTLGVGLDKGWKIGKGIGHKLGKLIGGTGGKILRKTKDLGNLINNPFDEISNAIIRFLISLIGLGFFFDDLIAKKIIENKKQILVVIISIVLTFTMFFSSLVKTIYVEAGGILGENGVLGISEYDLNIFATLSPSLSPFGGEGMDNTQITAGYLDPNYYANFGRWHKAIDIIPTQNYYKTDKAFIKLSKVYIYATCDGNATTSLDKAGAIIIEIECDDLIHKVMYAHESFSFIPFNSKYRVMTGQAIGIMGCTGLCYGSHVHYVVSVINLNKEYETTDPTLFIY